MQGESMEGSFLKKSVKSVGEGEEGQRGGHHGIQCQRGEKLHQPGGAKCLKKKS